MKKFNICQTYPKQNIVGNSFVNYTAYTELSPIDEYFKATKKIFSDAQTHKTDSNILNLYFIQLMSTVEHYFRNILFKYINICPHTQDVASEKMIRIGSVLWYDQQLLNLGMFEHVNFSESSNIKNTLENIANFKINPKSSLGELLKDYEILCEIRHTIVHSNSQLNGKNAIRLKVSKKKGHSACIQFTIEKLEEAIASCNALISAFNNDLFNFTLTRSAEKWPEYNHQFNFKNFKPLCKLFFSTETMMTEFNEFSKKTFDDFKKDFSKRAPQ